MDPFTYGQARVTVDGEPLDVTVVDVGLVPAPIESVPPIDIAALGGCPQCGVLPGSGVHLCEHGVTPAPTFEMSLTTTVDSATYRRLTLPSDDLPDPADVDPEDWWWLSFADGTLPRGSQFLGGALVCAGTRPDAVLRATALGINPGGGIRVHGPYSDDLIAERFGPDDRERLLSRADIETIDRRNGKT